MGPESGPESGGQGAGKRPDADAGLRTARNVGVGCFGAFIGFPSGGMIGVLVAKFVGAAQRCVPTEGLPACNWHVYALVGGLIGFVTLPALVLFRLTRRGARADSSKRG